MRVLQYFTVKSASGSKQIKAAVFKANIQKHAAKTYISVENPPQAEIAKKKLP